MNTREQNNLENLLHLLVLWSCAIVQPLFALLGKNPAFFVARMISEAEFIIIAGLIVCLPPAVFWITESVLAIFSEKAGRLVHSFFVWLMCFVFCLSVFRNVDWAHWRVVVYGSAVLAGFALYGYLKLSVVPKYLNFLVIAPITFLLVFLFVSPTRALVFQNDGQVVKADVKSTRPVIVVIFDEFALSSLLKDNRTIDKTRFPNFYRLSQRSTWFNNAVTNIGQTTQAVPEILTGNIPFSEKRLLKLPAFSDHPNNLFTWLGNSYDVNATEVVTDLCPQNVCRERKESIKERIGPLLDDLVIVQAHLLVPKGKRSLLPPIDTSWEDFGSIKDLFVRKTSTDVERQLDFVRDATINFNKNFGRKEAYIGKFVASLDVKPGTVHFLHAMLPHGPSQFTDSGQRYVPSRYDIVHGILPKSQAQVEVERQKYLVQVQFTDKILGELISKLERQGVWDDAVIVVTADHGRSFEKGSHFRLPNKVVADVAYVPLFVHCNNKLDGNIIDQRVVTADILPTIAHCLDEKLPFKVDGQNAFLPIVQNKNRQYIHKVKLPFDLMDRREREIQHKNAIFAVDTDFYHMGPYGNLVGKAVDSIPKTTGKPFAIRIEQASLFSKVEPRVSVPASIDGFVEQGLGAGDYVAIAVNGIIGATAEVFENDGGLLSIAAMVNPAVFAKGENTLEIFRISPNGNEIPKLQAAG